MNTIDEVTRLQEEIRRLRDNQDAMMEQQRAMQQTVTTVSALCERVTAENRSLRQEVQQLKTNWNGDHLVPAAPIEMEDR